MGSHARFVVTAWRDSRELLQLRHDLYSPETSRRENAVSKVFAWRLRKPDGLPLLLDSTADISDVILQDERDELKHNALRLLYATAISRVETNSPRFITGLADTQIDLTRDRPSWFPPGKNLQLPLALLEVRHRIVHRHLPSLAELKRAAKQSLEWLWEWYWSQLDHAFSIPPSTDDGEIESLDSIKERLQNILKTYIKERKTAIKTRKTGLNAATNALSTYTLRFSEPNNTPPPPRIQDTLLDLLIHGKMILPTEKKLGSSMSGAFLIWTPFLLTFCTPPSPTTTSPSQPLIPTPTLLTHLLYTMNAPSPSHTTINPALDPVREGMHDWILHLLGSTDCAPLRVVHGEKKLVEDVLTTCFSEPSAWNVKLAESILKHAEWRGKEGWGVLLGAVREGGVDGEVGCERGKDGEGGEGASGVEAINEEKIKGPRKVLGLWKPRPIGWLPEGFEEDD
ncbi:Las1-domain-containing protein [Plenodomus tracheiphilus IPT5]|uniref:Las1-domain-containing protein n=1 Tax=Plenodomus tracheiphilus IPT5 TaxID=1408161 RepID=A0A6A7AYH6_9PLEO|nr:Las1-domain-containing protein [Plenodomus tracheiphilus IPT5]